MPVIIGQAGGASTQNSFIRLPHNTVPSEHTFCFWIKMGTDNRSGEILTKKSASWHSEIAARMTWGGVGYEVNTPGRDAMYYRTFVNGKGDWQKTGYSAFVVIRLNLNELPSNPALTPTFNMGSWAESAGDFSLIDETPGNPSTFDFTNSRYIIGNNADANDPFYGAIGHVALWNRRLTDAEVAGIVVNQNAPDFYSNGLLWYYPLENDYVDKVSGLAVTGSDLVNVSFGESVPVNYPNSSPSPSPSPSPNPPTSQRVALPNGATKRVYLIGNSVTDSANYEGLDAIATANSYTHDWGRHMIPGAPLQWIWDHPTDGFQQAPYGLYPQAFANYTWDDVSLQPFDRDLATDLDYIGRYLGLILPQSPNVQLWIMQRWLRQRGDGPNDASYYTAAWNAPYSLGGYDVERRAFFEQLRTAVETAHPTLTKKPLLIPVGEVFYRLNLRMAAGEFPGVSSIFDWYADGIHVNNIGSYVTGLTFYSTMYYRDPRGTAVPSQYGSIPAATVQKIQDTVWEVVTTYAPAGGVAPTGGSNTAPIASFTCTPTSGKAPLAVSFDASASLDPDSGDFILGYEWDFGDGSPLSVMNAPTHTYTVPGEYTVTLRVMDNRNQYSQPITRTVTVQAPDPLPVSANLGLSLEERKELSLGLLSRIDRGTGTARLKIYSSEGGNLLVNVPLSKPSFSLDQSTGALVLVGFPGANLEANGTIPNTAVATLESGAGTVVFQALTVGLSTDVVTGGGSPQIKISKRDLVAGERFRIASMTIHPPR